MSAVIWTFCARARSRTCMSLSAWPPQSAHGELHVRYLDGQPRLAANRDDLVDGLPLRSVLAPDVADVSPARSRCDLRERHHFRRRRVDAGIVFESGRETERASSHLGTEQFLHAAHFLGRRRSFEVVAHHLMPDGPVTGV